MDSPQPHDDLPAEMVEEILLYLPVKSLLRFSSVSKAWKSMIYEPGFRKRYRGFAALPGRERIVLEVGGINSFSIESRMRWENESLADGGRICTFSCTSESSPEKLLLPLECETVRLKALCDELWLATVDDDGPLFLWNLSMRSFKHIPDPSRREARMGCWGLGYDSVGDDYKILRFSSGNDSYNTAELYSLRSDGWRMIAIPDDFSTEYSYIHEPAVCVSGNLHFTCFTSDDDDVDLISFNLSREKFGKVAFPANYSPETYGIGLLTVLRGMLCLGHSYHNPPDEDELAIWVMEEYGVASSWTKKFCIKQFHPFLGHTPLHFGENGELLIVALNVRGESMNLVYEDEKSRPVELRYRSNSCQIIFNVYTYVESLAGLDWHCSH